jgi:CubicO group peptidase (beta-lactamase class C family)
MVQRDQHSVIDDQLLRVKIQLRAAVDVRLDALIPPQYLEQLSSTKRGISLRDLLTMSSGFEWHENDGTLPANTEYNAWIQSADPVAYLLARPLVAAPGTFFTYNTAGTHLLSVLLTTATGPLTKFAFQSVFEPLGIHDRLWEIFPDSTPNGGSGLRLRPRDFAKIGAGAVVEHDVPGGCTAVGVPARLTNCPEPAFFA